MQLKEMIILYFLSTRVNKTYSFFYKREYFAYLDKIEFLFKGRAAILPSHPLQRGWCISTIMELQFVAGAG